MSYVPGHGMRAIPYDVRQLPDAIQGLPEGVEGGAARGGTHLKRFQNLRERDLSAVLARL